MPQAPKNTTLVQVGFLYGLNYPFVSTTKGSASQIFQYLPAGVAHGLGLEEREITMHALEPYDTTRDLGYITTLALFYIPTDMVNQLSVDLHTPVSPIYNNPGASVKQLMSYVNPTIPLVAGQPLDGSGTSGDSASPTGTGTADDGAPFSDDSNQSAPVKTTSVAIGISAAAGAVLYGAAMVFVARRYKARRSRHQRSSSMPSSGSRSPTGYSSGAGAGGAWMSGARGGLTGDQRDSHGSRGSSNGRSARTAGISAPVMAENSLGWN